MTTLIVYDSPNGNTKKIAEEIAKALGGKAIHVSEATNKTMSVVELLIVGSPTYGGRPTPVIQQFIDSLPNLNSIKVAAFDTRLEAAIQGFGLKLLMKVIGYAAPKMATCLVKKGGKRAVPPEGFFVTGKTGPLKAGERERASFWAKQIQVSG